MHTISGTDIITLRLTKEEYAQYKKEAAALNKKWHEHEVKTRGYYNPSTDAYQPTKPKGLFS